MAGRSPHLRGLVAPRSARGRAARLVFGAVVALVMMCSTAFAAGRATAHVAGGGGSFRAMSGINAWSTEQLPQNELLPQLAAMEADGVQVVRSDAPWYLIEPHAPGTDGRTWQTWQTDDWVTNLANDHLTWEPIVDYSAPWVTQSNCAGTCGPTSSSAYAAFAQFVASRYGEHGTFWQQHPNLPYYPAHIFEIWNEENDWHFWSPGPQPAAYAQLYSKSRTAIHAVDPTAEVIVGGMIDTPAPVSSTYEAGPQFVQSMLAADPSLKGHIDGFGLHTYAGNAEQIEQWVITFREALDRMGEGSAPIDITEFGWTTGTPLQEEQRAAQMNAVASALSRSNCGIQLLAPYDWMNPDFLHESGDYGFVDRTGLNTVLRPAGTAWFDGLARALSMPELPLCPASEGLTPPGNRSSRGSGKTSSHAHLRRASRKRHGTGSKRNDRRQRRNSMPLKLVLS